jgi:hypothetical protein
VAETLGQKLALDGADDALAGGDPHDVVAGEQPSEEVVEVCVPAACPHAAFPDPTLAKLIVRGLGEEGGVPFEHRGRHTADTANRRRHVFHHGRRFESVAAVGVWKIGTRHVETSSVAARSSVERIT